MEIKCEKSYVNEGYGKGGFTANKYYEIVRMYKNPGHELHLNFVDDLGDELQLKLSEATEIFDFKGAAK